MSSPSWRRRLTTSPRAKICSARALDSRSTMVHGIFRAAAVESAAKAGIAPPEDHRRFRVTTCSAVRLRESMWNLFVNFLIPSTGPFSIPLPVQKLCSPLHFRERIKVRVPISHALRSAQISASTLSSFIQSRAPPASPQSFATPPRSQGTLRGPENVTPRIPVFSENHFALRPFPPRR